MYEPETFKRMDFSSKVGWCLLLALVATVGGFLLAVLLLSATADGRADFCYLHGTTRDTGRTWMVEAHRPWRSDLSLGYFATPEEARAEAEKFKCRFYTEPRP